MNCQEMENRLIAYVDGRAPDADRSEVEAHLSACPECRARAGQFGRLWILLDEAPSSEPALAFDARLRARIAAQPRSRWLDWLVPSPRLAFAASLLAVLSVWVTSRPPGPPADSREDSRVEDEGRMLRDLQSLEDYDLLAGLEALSDLQPAGKPDRSM